MLAHVVAVTPLDGTLLNLRFADGAEGIVDIAEITPFDGVFAPLADPAYFRSVQVNHDIGTIWWPSGADIDPHVLYSRVTGAPLPGQGLA